MADLSITAASVVQGTGATLRQVTAGATITQGQPVYLDTTESYRAKRCDADVLESAVCAGIALNSVSSGQPLLILVSGNLTINAVATVGQLYVVSTGIGAIAPYSDLATGDYVTYLGVATSTTVIAVQIQISGVAKP